MRIYTPTIRYQTHGTAMAPRPDSLDGKVIGLFDGWGRQLEDGSFTIYPLMDAWAQLLGGRFRIGNTIWFKKPNVSQAVPEELLEEFARNVDLVVNGECA